MTTEAREMPEARVAGEARGTAFGTEWIAAADDPAWLSALREAAAGAFQQHGFPTTKNEDWHFTSPAPITGATFVEVQKSIKGLK